MATFHKFALIKIENGWANRVVKPLSHTTHIFGEKYVVVSWMKINYFAWRQNCVLIIFLTQYLTNFCGGSRTTATSKMKLFEIIVNGFQPLTNITKNFILDVAAGLDPSLNSNNLISVLLRWIWNSIFWLGVEHLENYRQDDKIQNTTTKDKR